MSNSIAVTPDSTIRLIQCPIKLDDHNQITFNTIAAQETYFKSLPYLTDSNMTYIRKDNVIRIGTSNETDYEDLLKYNYCMYQNTHYDTKWFYAYITNVRYVNDGCTEITIDTDVFQTWYFDVNWESSFIEREHVNDDTIGKHTIPENIEHGDYIANTYDYTSELDPVSYVLCATTGPQGEQTTRQTLIGDIPYQGYIYVTSTGSDLANIISSFGTYQQNIYAVYAVPSFAVANAVSATAPDTPFHKVTIPSNEKQIVVTKQTTLDGYSPKNNKLKCFPYNYLLVSNNNGQSNILKYERFSTSNCTFGLNTLATMGCDIKLTPLSYDHLGHDEQNSLVGGKWPTLSWSQDMFTNWMSQNAVNIGIGQATSVLSIIGGAGLIATGVGTMAGVGMITGGIGGIVNSMVQQHQHSMDPNSFKGNVNSGSINVDAERNGFYFYKMSIKSEYAQMIDNFFNFYGYKVNRFGIPHLKARTYWDYCKTIEANITGNIPESDMIKLRALFNTGCTFWHDTTHFLDYSQNNTIVT